MDDDRGLPIELQSLFFKGHEEVIIQVSSQTLENESCSQICSTTTRYLSKKKTVRASHRLADTRRVPEMWKTGEAVVVRPER